MGISVKKYRWKVNNIRNNAIVKYALYIYLTILKIFLSDKFFNLLYKYTTDLTTHSQYFLTESRHFGGTIPIKAKRSFCRYVHHYRCSKLPLMQPGHTLFLLT